MDFSSAFLAHRPKHFDAKAALEVATSYKTCADPKDRILAIYNLAHLDEVTSLSVGHSESAGEIHRQFSLAVLAQHPDPETMFHLIGTEAPLSTAESLRRPSWVPDYHHLTRTSMVAITSCQAVWNSACTFRSFRSSRDRCQLITTADDPWILNIRGKCYAEIIELLPDSGWPDPAPADGDLFTRLDVPNVLAWFQRCRNFASPILGSPEEDAWLVSLLVGHSIGYTETRCTEPDLLILKRLFSRLWRGSCQSFEDYIPSILPPLVEGYGGDLRMRDALLARVRVGDSIRIARVNKMSRAGDHFCLFAGMEWSLVVRARPEGEFQLIGGCDAIDVSLYEALREASADHSCVSKLSKERESFRRTWNSWSSEHPEMKQLMDGLGWISLK